MIVRVILATVPGELIIPVEPEEHAGIGCRNDVRTDFARAKFLLVAVGDFTRLAANDLGTQPVFGELLVERFVNSPQRRLENNTVDDDLAAFVFRRLLD